MKFYNTIYSFDKKYASDIMNKVNTFKNNTKTRKNLFVTFISSYGLKQNKYRLQHVQNELVLDDLFVKTKAAIMNLNSYTLATYKTTLFKVENSIAQ